jgi:hypothetical protein
MTNPSASLYGTIVVSGLVYLNGSTDYVEMYGLIYATGPQIYNGSYYTYMTGSLVRAA